MSSSIHQSGLRTELDEASEKQGQKEEALDGPFAGAPKNGRNRRRDYRFGHFAVACCVSVYALQMVVALRKKVEGVAMKAKKRLTASRLIMCDRAKVLFRGPKGAVMRVPDTRFS